MGDPKVTVGGLGAWVLKGNADRTDLVQRVALDPRVERWCVRPGYRARLMAAGQPAVLWVSGSRRGTPSGVCAIGRVTGPAVADPADGGWSVPLDLTVEDRARWLPRQAVRERIGRAEVFRQPQGGNPSFLAADEYAVLLELWAARP